MSETSVAQQITTRYLSSITYKDKNQPNIEEKLRYFSDCLDMVAQSMMTPCNELNLNPKIFCKLLYKILTCTNGQRLTYFEEIYKEYNVVINYDVDYIIKKYYQADFKKLSELINELQPLRDQQKLEQAKGKIADQTLLISYKSQIWAKVDEVIGQLSIIIVELNDSYFERVIEVLTRVICCPNHIDEHNHRKHLEYYAHIVIVEYMAIGYTRLEAIDMFGAAIKNNFEDFQKKYPSQIYRIPVPPALWNQRNELSFRSYKNRVKKHIEKANLLDQLQNILFLHKQVQHERTFVFRIQNAKLQEDLSSIVFHNTTYANSFSDEFIDSKSNKKYKDFFKENPQYCFCKVVVESGNSADALQLAITAAKEGLGFINVSTRQSIAYNKRSSRISLDLSGYVMVDAFGATRTEQFATPIKRIDKDSMELTFKMEAVMNSPTIDKYKSIDKIFFNAFNSDTKIGVIDQLWRYIECLFKEFNQKDEIIKRVVKYYNSKTKHLTRYGLNKRMHFYIYDLLHHTKLEDGFPRAEWNNMLRTLDYSMDKGNLDQANNLIQHPLVNNAFDKVYNLTDDEALQLLTKHNFRLLYNCNTQRNLFQHSNEVIPELLELWYEELLTTITAFRYFLINDLISDPNQTIEDIIPK